MPKITAITLEGGKVVDVSKVKADSLPQLIGDVQKTTDLAKTLAKYGAK